ncbi:hypothetical protein PspR32_12615 [Pseudomonas sp. R32]|nr:hypothetical protein PspR32_12615 [Pseudomonas sp. R32]
MLLLIRAAKVTVGHQKGHPLAQVYPPITHIGWEHINLTGGYVWRQGRKLEDGKFRPLRQVGKP